MPVSGRSFVLIVGALTLTACAGQVGFQTQEPPPAPPPVASAPPSSIPAASLVGRWGFAAYHKEGDRARTEAAARGQCGRNGQPYVIGAGASGGVLMHLAD